MRHTLQTVFGHSDFRPGQEAVVRRILAGHSALAVFPTGAGKSICFQLPALLLDGLTLVVSPLIALMKDQIDRLESRGVAAARIDSTLDGEAARGIYERIREGRLKLLYVSPERLHNERFLARLANRHVAMLAIDEAHCICEWGHNFRPDYLKLPQTVRALNIGRVLAVTATATPTVATEIASSLGIPAESIFRTPFSRPNLELHLRPGSEVSREQGLLTALQPGANLVYVTTQRAAERVAKMLSARGRAALAYHAGMENEDRARVQDAFMASSELTVVATIAFGMGVDKPDIRSIIHYNLPKSMENYAQEIGRAGRDGQSSRCTLLAAPTDLVPLQNFIYGDTPDRESVEALLKDLPAGDFSLSLYQFSKRYDMRLLVLETLLSYLEMEGCLEATGPYYTDYQVAWNRPEAEILTLFDPLRANFLHALFARGRRAALWTHLNMEKILQGWDETRTRVVAALGYLEEQGHIRVKATGAMRGYRRLSKPLDSQTLMRRFQSREERDLDRLRQMWNFAQHSGCASQELAAYFGETLKACGRCGSCQGQPPQMLALQSTSVPDSLLSNLPDHPALQHPRQLTRFLCGISSPAATAARLHRHPKFGALGHLPFAQVLLALPARAA
jgi:ATP-dependent DNA helicase RecQ